MELPDKVSETKRGWTKEKMNVDMNSYRECFQITMKPSNIPSVFGWSSRNSTRRSMRISKLWSQILGRSLSMPSDVSGTRRTRSLQLDNMKESVIFQFAKKLHVGEVHNAG